MSLSNTICYCFNLGKFVIETAQQGIL